MRAVCWCLVGLLSSPALAAQDTAIVIHPESTGVHFTPSELPRVVADEAIRLYNAAGTTRLVGYAHLARGHEWRGDVAVRGGPALIEGRIQGTLLVVNGDAALTDSAAISGDVFVVGGTVSRAPGARVGGEVREYRDPLPYRANGEALTYAPNLRRRFLNPQAQLIFGTAEARSALTLATGGTFNRVEGLPIVFGPVFDWRVWGGGDAHLRLDALGVFRTAGDLSDKRSDMGYSLRAELRVRENLPYGLGLRAMDVVSPVEDWGLHAEEVGWAAFLFHRDYRDYFLNKGWAARTFYQPERPLTLSLEFRREWMTSVAARDPLTVTRNDQVWRANPPIDDGHFNTWAATVVLDTRNDRDSPTSGWLLRTTLERSSSKDVIPQPGVPGNVRDSLPTNGSYRFNRAWIDLRRYSRVSPSGRLNLRLLAGGWAGGDPLPLQRRVSIGGPEVLPGYGFRQGACNQSLTAPQFLDARVAACDRVLAVQAEYRGHISLHWSYSPGRPEQGRGETLIRLEGPDLVVFGDAGQAWLVGRGPGRVSSTTLPDFSSWLADLGLGVDWGGFGAYFAKAVTVGQPLRFTLRLEHRF
jgi:surface antigen Omp85-like protein